MKHTSQNRIDVAHVRQHDLIAASKRRGAAFPTISELQSDAERAAWSVERALRVFLVVVGAVAAVNIAVKVLL